MGADVATRGLQENLMRVEAMVDRDARLPKLKLRELPQDGSWAYVARLVQQTGKKRMRLFGSW